MYESYTRQSLPTKRYRELLGSAICVFNSNNAFIVENILKCDDLDKYDWYHLIDLESGRLKGSVHEVITSKCGDEIELVCEGADEQEALKALTDAISSGLGE